MSGPGPLPPGLHGCHDAPMPAADANIRCALHKKRRCAPHKTACLQLEQRAAGHQTGHQKHDEDHDRDKEQQARDFRRGGGDAGESEHRRDQRYDEKNSASLSIRDSLRYCAARRGGSAAIMACAKGGNRGEGAHIRVCRSEGTRTAPSRKRLSRARRESASPARRILPVPQR